MRSLKRLCKSLESRHHLLKKMPLIRKKRRQNLKLKSTRKNVQQILRKKRKRKRKKSRNLNRKLPLNNKFLTKLLKKPLLLKPLRNGKQRMQQVVNRDLIFQLHSKNKKLAKKQPKIRRTSQDSIAEPCECFHSCKQYSTVYKVVNNADFLSV